MFFPSCRATRCCSRRACSRRSWRFNIWATLIVFYVAAILGNTSNYWIARFFGKRIIDSAR